MAPTLTQTTSGSLLNYFILTFFSDAHGAVVFDI